MVTDASTGSSPRTRVTLQTVALAQCVCLLGRSLQVALIQKVAASVSFQWKDPDFLFKNPDFLLKNVEFIINQERLHPPGLYLK